MATLEELKSKNSLTRDDIARLLKDIGGPGESQDIKRQCISELGKSNFQGIRLEETLEDYQEF